MKKVVEFFAERTFLVNLICAFIFIIGGVSLFNMKRALIPEFEWGSITISARLPNASAFQVEKFVTYPIEENLQGLGGVDRITSNTSASRVSITIEVQDGFKKIDDLLEKVKDRVEAVKSDLPSEVENINVEKFARTSEWLASIILTHFDEKNVEHQKFYQKMKRSFTKIPHVIKFDTNIRTPRFYIEFFPKKLSRYQIGLEEIYNTIDKEAGLVSIGTYKNGDERISLEIENSLSSKADLEQIVLKSNTSGEKIRLRDLALIEYRLPERSRIGLFGKDESNGIWLFKDLESDTITLKDELILKIDELKKLAPEGIGMNMPANGAEYIERQLSTLKNNGSTGLVIVLVCLFIFLGFKASVLTSFSLPLAYLGTFAVLGALGMKIDLISVVGMILILGILVDDAIIVSEQYIQHLEEGLAPKDAAVKAVMRTIIPVTGTIITTVVAFLPILLSTSGLSNILLAIPIVVISALAISWFESFFILPNHLQHYVKKDDLKKETKYFDKAKAAYKKILMTSLKFRYVLFPLLLLFMGGSLYFAYKKVPMKYNLRIGSEKIRVSVALKETKGLEDTLASVKPLLSWLEKMDKTKYSYLSTKIGNTWIGGKRQDGHRFADLVVRFSQTHKNLKEGKEYVEKYIEEGLKNFKTDRFETLTMAKSIEGKEDAKDNLIDISFEGRTKKSFDEFVTELKSTLAPIEGLKEVIIDPDIQKEYWKFIPNREALSRFNLSLRNLSSQLASVLSEQKVLEIRTNNESVNVIGKIYQDELSKNRGKEEEFKNLGHVPIRVGNGQTTALKNLGYWVSYTGLKSIKHKNLENSYSLSASFDSEKIKKEAFIEKLKAAVVPLGLNYPRGSFSVEDADEESKKNKKAMDKMLLICLVLILFVLALVLGSLIQPLLIGMAIPFGVIGVIWAFYFHGQTIDVMALVGIIAMAGVVVNDSLIMVDLVNHLKKERPNFGRSDIVEGASKRLRAILLTSITTLGGVFPMAYGIGGDSGFTKPLALSMGWGLLFATVLTLFMIPCLLEIQMDLHTFLKFLMRSARKLLGKLKRPKNVAAN
ncbi:MAG: efflux RND transporter permease subunit [Bacteriovoracaceae bacterium]|nr:efflux RND transporter permease subunit [Bacteriovoracaceae bacterium]